MTAPRSLIAKQVSASFRPRSTPAARRRRAPPALIAPLRNLPRPARRGDQLGADRQRGLRGARPRGRRSTTRRSTWRPRTLYRERFGDTPGIVYAAGRRPRLQTATAFRAAGVKAEPSPAARPGQARGDPRRLRARRDRTCSSTRCCSRRRWNSPRATVVCTSPRPRPSASTSSGSAGSCASIAQGAGVVVDFRPKGATHSGTRRLAPLASERRLYREGARVTRRRGRRPQRRGRRKLTRRAGSVPSPRRRAAARGDPARVAAPSTPSTSTRTSSASGRRSPGARCAFDERQSFVQKFTAQGASKGALETFLATCAAQNPNRRLRLIALADRVSMRVERADFDDLVTLSPRLRPGRRTAPPGSACCCGPSPRASRTHPTRFLARWTWKLARAVRKTLDRKASQDYPDAKRLLGALANSRGQRQRGNAARLVKAAL